jgi:hypothetical protein
MSSLPLLLGARADRPEQGAMFDEGHMDIMLRCVKRYSALHKSCHRATVRGAECADDFSTLSAYQHSVRFSS